MNNHDTNVGIPDEGSDYRVAKKNVAPIFRESAHQLRHVCAVFCVIPRQQARILIKLRFDIELSE